MKVNLFLTHHLDIDDSQWGNESLCAKCVEKTALKTYYATFTCIEGMRPLHKIKDKKSLGGMTKTQQEV